MRHSYQFEWIYQELEQGSPRHQQSAARRNFPKVHEPIYKAQRYSPSYKKTITRKYFMC